MKIYKEMEDENASIKKQMIVIDARRETVNSKLLLGIYEGEEKEQMIAQCKEMETKIDELKDVRRNIVSAMRHIAILLGGEDKIGYDYFKLMD